MFETTELKYGYAGKILHVNLTTGEITTIDSSTYLPRAIGGRALAANLYWDYVPKECEPFDPENCIIMTAGALTGTGAAMAAIGICTGKSASMWPGHSYQVSQCACDWPNAMKYAGYDAFIITGAADHPVYLNIQDDKVEICDCADLDLWGTMTSACYRKLVETYGHDTHVACIGPAGENLVVQGVINTDSNSAFSMGGYAAVMGSKKLKAIAVNGTGYISVADPDRIMELNEVNRVLLSMREGETRDYHGTTLVGHRDPTMSLFYPNPQSGLHEDMRQGKCGIRMHGCPGCYRMCRTKVHYYDGSVPDGSWDCGETVGQLSSEQAYYGGRPYGKHNRAIAMYQNDLGLDTFQNSASGFSIFDTGATKIKVEYTKQGKGAAASPFDTILAAVSDGTLSSEICGVDFNEFGSEEFMFEWLRKLAYRDGWFHDLYANGYGAMVDYIVNHEEFGPKRERFRHYWERTFPKAGPFGNFGRHCFMLGYGEGNVRPLPSATLYTGVNVKRGREPHAIMGHPGRGVTPPPEKFTEHFYGNSNFEGDNWGPDLAKAVAKHELYSMECDSAPYCSHNTWIIPSENFFSWNDPEDYTKWSLMCYAEYLSAVHGREITEEETLRADEQAINLERAIWIRDGYLEGPVDTFWDCIFEEEGKDGVILVPRDQYEQCLQYYYGFRGWKNGVPTRETLHRLDMDDVADTLEQKYGIEIPA